MSSESTARRGGSLAHNTAVLALGTFLPKAASFIILPLLTGDLTQAEYGTYDLIVVLSALLIPSATLQISTAAFRFLVDDRDNDAEVRAVVSTILGFAVPVAAVVAVVSGLVVPSGAIAVRGAVVLFLFADALQAILLQIARGLGMNWHYSVSAIVGSIGQLAFAVVAVGVLGLGLAGALVALFAAALISVFYLYRACRIGVYVDLGSWDLGKLRRYLAYSWPMVPNYLSLWAITSANRLIVTYFAGVEANAEFAVANKIPQILALAQSAFVLAWQESATRAIADDNVADYYSRMFSGFLRLVSWVLAIVLAGAPLLFAALIRGGYSDALREVPILAFGMFAYSISGFLGGIYVALMRSRSVGVSTVVAALVNIGLAVVLVPALGVRGASLAMLVGYLVLAVYRMVDVRRFIRLEYRWADGASVALLLGLVCLTDRTGAVPLEVLGGAIAILGGAALNGGLLRQAVGRLRH